MKEHGVSNVIGVILLIGILSVFMVVVRIDWVPEWQEEKESRMSAEVEGQLGAMASGMQQGLDAPVVYPLDLSRPTSFWIPHQLPASVTFANDATAGTISADIQELTRNGQFAAATNPDWAPLTSATMEGLAWMRMHLDTVGGGNGEVIITFSDDGGLLGTIEVEREGNLRISLLEAGGQVIDTEFVSHSGPPAEYVLDILEDIDTPSILQNIEGDLQLDVTQNDLGATFAWAFVDGGTVSSNSGPEYTWNPSFQSGALSVDMKHSEYAQQVFRLENGAILLQQPDGDVVRFPGSLQISDSAIQLQWVSLVGVHQTASDSRSLGVQFAMTSEESLTGITDQLTYTLTTDSPQAWATQWTQQFQTAGIPSAQYTIIPAAGSVTLTYTGPEVDASHDITVSWTQRTYNVEISQ